MISISSMFKSVSEHGTLVLLSTVQQVVITPLPGMLDHCSNRDPIFILSQQGSVRLTIIQQQFTPVYQSMNANANV